MHHAPDAPIILLSPHLDDAVYSAWSVLKSEREVTVVNVCTRAPEPGFVTRYDKVAGATDSHEFVAQRIAEDRAALALAGREPVSLGFVDDQYREEELDMDAVAQELERHVSAASLIVGPGSLGGHPDHLAVRSLALRYLALGIPLELYADLPYAVRYGWPHTVSGDQPKPNLSPQADWDFHLEGVTAGHDLDVRVHEFDDVESAQKLVAMHTYRTQFPSLNSGPIDRLANPRIRRYEVLWSVTARDA